MATSIGDLVATLGVNNRPFARGLAGAQAQLSAFAGRVKATALTIAGAFGVGFGFAAAKRAIDAYTRVEQAEKKLAAVIRATGGAAGFTLEQMKDYAKQLSRVTNFGRTTTLSAMSLLATFRNVGGETFKRATALAQDLASVMGGDLDGAMRRIGRALDNPIAGMTALTRIGVTFSEQQKKQIKGFVEAGNLAAAQGMILDTLKGKVGGAAEAMADPLIQANNRMTSMAATIGGVLKPAWVDLVNTFVGGAESMIGGMQYVADAIQTVLFAARNFTRLVQVSFLNAIIGIIEAFPSIEPPINRIGEVFFGVMAGVWGMFYNVLERMQKAITALVDAIQSAFDVMQAGISGNMIEAGNAMSRLLGANERFVGQATGMGGVGKSLGASFSEAYGQAMKDYAGRISKSGGFTGWLKGMREGLLGEIGASESARLAKPKQFVPSLAGVGPMGGAAKTVKQDLPGILEKGSAEAWKKIVGAMYGTDQDKAAVETAKATRDAADTLKRIENREPGEEEGIT